MKVVGIWEWHGRTCIDVLVSHHFSSIPQLGSTLLAKLLVVGQRYREGGGEVYVEIMCFLWLANVQILKQIYLMSFSIHVVKINLYMYHLGLLLTHLPAPMLLKKISGQCSRPLWSQCKIPVTIWKGNRAKTSGLKYIGIAFLQSLGLLCENKQGSNLLEGRGFYP